MNKDNFGITIVATPIGNLGDISSRAINTIKNSDFVICENPKHSIKLLNKFGIKKKLISLHDYNEDLVIQKISNQLPNKNIVLISDAGSPLISDPGFKLIQHCIKNKVNISTVPGPSSIIPALQLSGIPTNEFLFLGYCPKKKNDIVDFIENIKNSNITTVFFVSTHKIKMFIEILGNKLQARSVSISKELTKLNEKTIRGPAKDIGGILIQKSENTKGEFVLVVEGNNSKKTEFTNTEIYNKEIYKMLTKFSLTDVVEIVHKLTGISKNIVYKWVLKLKKS